MSFICSVEYVEELNGREKNFQALMVPFVEDFDL